MWLCHRGTAVLPRTEKVANRVRRLEGQLRERGWITLAEIAEWIGRTPGTVAAEDGQLARASAYLIRGLLRGKVKPRAFIVSADATTDTGVDRVDDDYLAALTVFDTDAGMVGCDERKQILWPAYYECIWIDKRQAVAWCVANDIAPKPNWLPPEKVKFKRGAEGRWESHWPKIKAQAMALLREKGIPKRNGPDGWNKKSDLEKKVAQFCIDTWDDQPSHGSLDSKLSEWVTEFEAASANLRD